MKKRILSLIALTLALILLLTGCSSGSDKSVSAGIVIAAKYVDDENFTVFGDGLIAAFPQMNNDETSMSIQSVPTGDAASDPMGTMAGMTKITAMMTAGEIDVLICDPENARRYSDNGETYIPLSDLFTEEEMAQLNITGVALPVVDAETGEETGETTAELGVSLSDNAKICELFPIESPAAYVIAGTRHKDNAREILRYLITLE